jgi:metal-dependent HD superfamily phosphatase/phosphodiesterase
MEEKTAEQIRTEIAEEQAAEEGKQLPHWTEVSPKEKRLNDVLIGRTEGRVHDLLVEMLADQELHLYHSYGNAVSVRRLGYNDHGPVHARIVTYNALKLLHLLSDGGVKTSLEAEKVADFEASQVAVALGAFLHDFGMGVAREAHEWHSIHLADPFIIRYLEILYPDDLGLRVALRAMAHEIIVGHMAQVRIHSVEAGVVLVADGTDMSRGRSRIPQLLERDPVVGDMHRYSASSINRVDITEGEQKPVRINISMDHVTGLFQVEEVLMTKVKASPIMPHLEVAATVADQKPRFYLS